MKRKEIYVEFTRDPEKVKSQLLEKIKDATQLDQKPNGCRMLQKELESCKTGSADLVG